MFARYFIELPLDAEQVERGLTRAPSDEVPGFARAATHHGDRLLADVGFGGEVRAVRPVEIEFGAPVRLPAKTLIPMRWTPAGSGGIFPALDADMEIGSLAPGTTQLAMSARYVPPMGPLGRVIDRVVLFRVAEATLKDFLDRVGEAMLASRPTMELRKMGA
jgi:hypothetical protein